MDRPNNPAGRRRGRPRGFHTGDQPVIKTLDRAMEVLAVLSRRDGVGLTALSDAAGEAPATVYRILATLQLHGLVESDDATQTWHVGAGAFRIGTAFLRRSGVVERSRHELRRLMEESGETANLGILSDGQVLFLGQVETRAPIRAFFPPGTRAELHASGIGKVLLAHLPRSGRAAVLSGALPRFTPSTLTDPDALDRDLARIRATGYAIDDEERNAGMRCIAAPIFGAHGEVAAGLSVSGPAHRVTPDAFDRLARLVAAAARRVSEGLGHDPGGAQPPDRGGRGSAA